MNSDIQTHYECVRFYNEEAELLDNWEIDEWLDLLTDDIRYRAPVRETKENRNRDEEFSSESFHFRDDKERLKMRVQKANHEYSWSHLPPVRDRRFVSNVRVIEEDDEEVSTRSNLLVRVGERDVPGATDILTCERYDTLRRTDGGYKLAKRDIYLDETSLDIPLMIFF